jgi:hypothetical protein
MAISAQEGYKLVAGDLQYDRQAVAKRIDQMEAAIDQKLQQKQVLVHPQGHSGIRVELSLPFPMNEVSTFFAEHPDAFEELKRRYQEPWGAPQLE